MNTKDLKQQETYTAPEIRLISVHTEMGFAISGSTIEDMDYGQIENWD